MSKSGVRFLGMFTVWFLFFYTLAWIISFSNKHIDYEQKWFPVKVALNRDVMGSWLFVAQRQAVFDSALDLAKWYGNNELISRSAFEDSSCWFFELSIPLQGIFLATLRQADQPIISFLLSRSHLEKTSIVKFDQHGKLLSRKIISQDIRYSDNEPLVVRVCRQERDVSFVINDRNVASVKIASNRDKLWFGIGNRAHTVIIDEVRQLDREGNSLFKDDFSTQVPFWLVIIISLIAVLIHQYCARNQTQRNYVLVISSMTICLLLYAGFDRFFWSRQLPYNSWQSDSLKIQVLQGFEKIRDSFFPYATFKQVFAKTMEFAQVSRIVNYEHWHETKNHFTYGEEAAKRSVLLLGASQTWGAGATYEKFTVGAQIQKMLEEERNDDAFLELFAVAGATSQHLAKLVEEEKFNKLFWDSIVINLASNDQDLEKFRSGIERLLRWSSQRSRNIFLVKEANSPEFSNELLKRKHEILSELAFLHKHRVIETDIAVGSKKVFQTGHVWWDYVHLTDWGQYLLAREIVKSLLFEE